MNCQMSTKLNMRRSLNEKYNISMKGQMHDKGGNETGKVVRVTRNNNFVLSFSFSSSCVKCNRDVGKQDVTSQKFLSRQNLLQSVQRYIGKVKRKKKREQKKTSFPVFISQTPNFACALISSEFVLFLYVQRLAASPDSSSPTFRNCVWKETVRFFYSPPCNLASYLR